jgi:hypothetical protein
MPLAAGNCSGLAVLDEGVPAWDEVESLELEPQPPRAAMSRSATAMAEGRRIAIKVADRIATSVQLTKRQDTANKAALVTPREPYGRVDLLF